MPIQILLVGAFLAILVFFVRNTTSHAASAWKRLLLIVFTAAAIAAVLFPDALTAIARALGVGRGTDLLLYATVAGFVVAMLVVYQKLKLIEEQMTELARHIAIIEAGSPDESDRPAV